MLIVAKMKNRVKLPFYWQNTPFDINKIILWISKNQKFYK